MEELGESQLENSQDATKVNCSFQHKGTMESRNDEVESKEQLEIKRLKEKNRSLREKINASTGDVSPEIFKEEEKVKHYTGLSYGILMSLYDYLEPHIP